MAQGGKKAGRPAWQVTKIMESFQLLVQQGQIPR